MMDYERLQREHAVLRAQLRCVSLSLSHICTLPPQKSLHHQSHQSCLKSPARYYIDVLIQSSPTPYRHHGKLQWVCQDLQDTQKIQLAYER